MSVIAWSPTATFDAPVVLLRIASMPRAVLPIPPLPLSERALAPMAVDRPPLAPLASALVPSAVLVLLPLAAPSEHVTVPLTALPTMK